jgi:galactose mutarotase-like enzyme
LSRAPILIQGFEALRLANDVLELRVIPELGGKIASLRDLHTGREWLWTSGELSYARHPYGTSYVAKADTGGWDECFPTVAACQDPRTGLWWPDHGELWSQSWEYRPEHDPDAISFYAEARGVQKPYLFSRTLRLHHGEAALELRYRVVNAGDEPLEYIWSAHPLFALEPGMRLKFPSSARFHLYYKPDSTVLYEAEPWSWPLEVNGFSLETLPDADTKAAFKIWSEPLSEGWAELQARDGKVRFEFDPAEIPQIGLWLNLGGWSGTGGRPHYNLALEPCIGAQDSLFEAVQKYRLYRTLEPGAAASWNLTVRLNP